MSKYTLHFKYQAVLHYLHIRSQQRTQTTTASPEPTCDDGYAPIKKAATGALSLLAAFNRFKHIAFRWLCALTLISPK